MDERGRFDAWLERSLRDELSPGTGRIPPAPAYAALDARRGRRLPLVSGVGAALASKAVTGFAMTAFAVGITGAVAVQTVTTGSPVPTVISQELRAVSQDLGQQLASAPADAPAATPVPLPLRPITALPEPTLAPQPVPNRPAVGAPVPAPSADGSRPQESQNGDSPHPNAPRAGVPPPQGSDRSDEPPAQGRFADEDPGNAGPKPSPSPRPAPKLSPAVPGSHPRPARTQGPDD